MIEPKPSGSWWQTLPGILTAIAAIITALGGLVAILVQAGVIGYSARDISNVQKEQSSTSAPAAHRESAESLAVASPVSGPVTPTPAVDSPLKTLATSKVLIIRSDGSSAEVSGDTFSTCINNNPTLTMANGQEIPFEKISSFEVTGSASGSQQIPLKVTLLSHAVLQGKSSGSCDSYFGYNDIGRYNIDLKNVKRIEFQR